MSDQSFTRKLEIIDSELYSQYQNCDRWAVIVGISKYQHSIINLKYADRDAESLYQLLLTPNGGSFKSDHICKLTNEHATTRNITRALRSFLKKPAREELVLIYFACHGSPDPDRPSNVYLLTHDTDPNDIAGTALPMEDIDRALKGILLSEKVIILADTCHSAAIGGGIGGRRSVVDDAKLLNRFLRDIGQSKGGVALLTSAEANEVSFEDTRWGGGHGVFTHYLLKGMRGAADLDGNGIVTIGELFEYVRDNVKQATDYRQHPSIGTNAYDRNLPVSIAPSINVSVISTSTTSDDVEATICVNKVLKEESVEEYTHSELCNLNSEREIDYASLRDLLLSEQWKRADQETASQMCKVMNRQKEGYLRSEDIQNFPCTDLCTINRLWVKYSNGKFGFSVQKEIWEECGSPNTYNLNWIKFGEKVGWKRDLLVEYDFERKNGFFTSENVVRWLGKNKRRREDWLAYDELIFDISAPIGQLPLMLCISDFGSTGFEMEGFSALFSRIETCMIALWEN